MRFSWGYCSWTWRAIRHFLSGLFAASLCSGPLEAQALVSARPYEPLTVAPDSVGTCRISEEPTPGVAQPTRTIRFSASADESERSIRMVEHPSNVVAYVETVAGGAGPATTLRGVVARIDSSGEIIGRAQFAKHVRGDPPPVPTDRALTVGELKLIPLMVNWLRSRCGQAKPQRTIEIDEIR